MKKLGFGCMRLPLLDQNNQKSFDMPQLCSMVDAFLERGFTYFDTAYMYHDFESERVMKQALIERHPRETFLLATWTGTTKPFSPGNATRLQKSMARISSSWSR